ncbi:hypothetical protein BC629DRAFT_1554707 [Irpex lacteus]|nr:hypothetical protein BC629DRAFT_1554707 [Irpex lacteus]
MECRLSSSSPDEPWTCKVSIRWEFDCISGNPLPDVSEVQFGSVITNKADVELMLRRAQCAVLNPSAPDMSSKEKEREVQKFVRMSSEEVRKVKNKLKFSANAVCLDLRGPDLTDLAFVDLPGIIQNADPETVKMVEDMVVTHIQGNCLILLTLPMSDDIENQKAARLAKQVDPSGRRTIGVLTKPDTLTAGAVKSKENWLAVLEGRRDKTTHGYFCTRQPDDDERTKGITSAEARRAEKTFFESTSPWSGSKHRKRFGTENLVENLATLLSKVIDETPPPPLTSDPSSFVLNLILDFCTKVKQHVQGNVTAAGLVQRNRRIYAKFKRDVRDSAVLFLPYASARDVPEGYNVHRFFRFDDEKDGEVNIDDYRSDSDSDSDGGARGTVGQRGQSRYMFLSDVEKYIRDATTRELPDNVPYAVKVMLIKRSQASWGKLAEGCWMDVRKVFEGVLGELVDGGFGRYDVLHGRVAKIVTDLIHKQTAVMSTRVRDTLELESTPFTQNGHYYQVTKAKYLSLYKDARSGKLQLPIQEPKRLRSSRDEDDSSSTNDKSKRKIASNSKVAFVDLTKDSPIAGSASSGGPFGSSSNGGFSFGTSSASSSNTFTFGAKPSGSGSTTSIFCQPSNAASSGTTSGGLFRVEQESAITTGVFPSAINKSRSRDGEAARPATPLSALPVTPTKVANPTPVENSRKRSLDKEKEAENEELTNQALAALAALGYHVSAADLGKLNPPDVFESELELMAEVRAYFQIAYKRVIDYIPMTVDHSFLFGFANALQEALIEQLGLGAPNSGTRCAAYLAEDGRIVALRDELMAKKRRLEGVQAELDNFGL